MNKKSEEFHERANLAQLQAKVREIMTEELPDSIKELLLENLVAQAYYTAKVDSAMAHLEEHLEKRP